MSTATNTRRNKHMVLDQNKLKRAQKVLGTRTETETVERALDRVISEDAKNRRVWAAHHRFIESAIKDGLQIRDVFGRLDDK